MNSLYVELDARSAFSFLEGASLPEFLMQQASDFEILAMALLDRNGVYGAPRFHIEGQKRGVGTHQKSSDYHTFESSLELDRR